MPARKLLETAEKFKLPSSDEEEVEGDCGICLGEGAPLVHGIACFLHHHCLQRWKASGRSKGRCPQCRSVIWPELYEPEPVVVEPELNPALGLTHVQPYSDGVEGIREF